jgi:hypothetical protein
VRRTLVERLRRALTHLGYSTIAMTLIGVMTLLMGLRFYGLPAVARDYLLQELEHRGITVSVDRLLLDPTGAIVAERVSVYRDESRKDLWLEVDRVRIGIAWLSWWRGKPFIQSASVANASVNLPLTANSIASLKQVNALVELEPGGIQVRGAEGRILNLEVSLRGRVAINGMPATQKRTPEELEALDRLWQQLVKVTDDFDTERPIKVAAEFDLGTQNWMQGSARVQVAAKLFRWRGALIDELSADAKLVAGKVLLEGAQLKLARGEVTLRGQADLVSREGSLELYSNADFTSFAPAIGLRAGEVVRRLTFTELPVLTARGKMAWPREGLRLDLQAEIDWHRFTYGATLCERLSIPIAYDGDRLFIPEATLITRNGTVRTEFYAHLRDPVVRATLSSNLNPSVLEGLLGSGADRFLTSLDFPEQGPELEVAVKGESLDPLKWRFAGTVGAKKFTYKKVALQSVSSSFTFENMELNLPDLVAKRTEGQVSGAVRENFEQRWVRIKDLRSGVNVHEVATILGDKFASYVAPYRFDKAPNLTVNGLVDLDDKKETLDTDLKVTIQGQGTLNYLLFQKTLPIIKPQGELSIIGRGLAIQVARAELFGGGLSGQVKVKLDPTAQEFTTALALREGDFKQIMGALFDNEKTSGKCNFDVEMAGRIGEMSTFKGKGNFEVSDGYILAIPFFSGLTSLVDGVIPGFKLGKAEKALTAYELTDGKISTKNLTISSSVFSMIGDGNYDYINDRANMDMRVNIRGVVGWITYPVSKLFEYHGAGSLKEVKWAPKIFGG